MSEIEVKALQSALTLTSCPEKYRHPYPMPVPTAKQRCGVHLPKQVVKPQQKNVASSWRVSLENSDLSYLSYEQQCPRLTSTKMMNFSTTMSVGSLTLLMKS